MGRPESCCSDWYYCSPSTSIPPKKTVAFLQVSMHFLDTSPWNCNLRPGGKIEQKPSAISATCRWTSKASNLFVIVEARVAGGFCSNLEFFKASHGQADKWLPIFVDKVPSQNPGHVAAFFDEIVYVNFCTLWSPFCFAKTYIYESASFMVLIHLAHPIFLLLPPQSSWATLRLPRRSCRMGL